ncbi:MAG: cupin domain-containing protein [Planctomycetota bacterium]
MSGAHNLFEGLPTTLPEELVDVLAQSESTRIERIVSTGHRSPEGFWYDQSQSEFVLLLRGEAKLLFEGDSTPVNLLPGDSINIETHRKHRVEWTSPDEPTVWLAVFY